MALSIDFIDPDGNDPAPVMITVAPERDQPEEMGVAPAKIDPCLYGLTGPEPAYAAARKAFRVETEKVGTDWFGTPIYRHGSFIYLIGPDGKLQTLLPPFVCPKGLAKIVKRYLRTDWASLIATPRRRSKIPPDSRWLLAVLDIRGFDRLDTDAVQAGCRVL